MQECKQDSGALLHRSLIFCNFSGVRKVYKVERFRANYDAKILCVGYNKPQLEMLEDANRRIAL